MNFKKPLNLVASAVILSTLAACSQTTATEATSKNQLTAFGTTENMQGSHAPKVNDRSIAICLIGGSDANGIWSNNFTNEQWVTLKALLLNLTKKYEIKKIIGHYQVDDKKECPSFKVPEYLEENDLQEYIYIG